MKELCKGCVVMMKASSGMTGYGNPQCVSHYTKETGSVGLYGHNQIYKDYDVNEILEYPLEKSLTPNKDLAKCPNCEKEVETYSLGKQCCECHCEI